jgi:hypothetical protein
MGGWEASSSSSSSCATGRPCRGWRRARLEDVGRGWQRLGGGRAGGRAGAARPPVPLARAPTARANPFEKHLFTILRATSPAVSPTFSKGAADRRRRASSGVAPSGGPAKFERTFDRPALIRQGLEVVLGPGLRSPSLSGLSWCGDARLRLLLGALGQLGAAYSGRRSGAEGGGNGTSLAHYYSLIVVRRSSEGRETGGNRVARSLLRAGSEGTTESPRDAASN